jgi:hypothetical protein
VKLPQPPSPPLSKPCPLSLCSLHLLLTGGLGRCLLARVWLTHTSLVSQPQTLPSLLPAAGSPAP